jgi:DNA-binding response OmpR family regulator
MNDKEIADVVSIHLKDLNLDTACSVDGRAGLRKVLDLMLKTNGLTVCTRTCEKNPVMPILVLTAESKEIDRLLAVSNGTQKSRIEIGAL